jgi:hypothetical protein
MVTKVKSFSLAFAGLGALAAVLAVGASGAGGTFVEQDVRVLHQFGSNGPAPAGSYFGWAVSELGDVDKDGVKEAIVGEPSNGADTSTGTTYVYSGRTGRLIYRFDGAAGDQNGFAMADAGDTNRDHVHDILVGSPGNGAGHVDLYSGGTGELLHRFTGAAAGDSFGWSVSSAGDVDRDHHADVQIGATQAPPAGAGPGYATIYSGRTYEPIRRLIGDGDRNQFGSGAGWSRDVDRDHVADQIAVPATPGPDAAARRTSTPAGPGNGSSRSTPPRRAASWARSSSRASATSTATARPTSTSATTRTRRTGSTPPGTPPAGPASTRGMTGTSCSPGWATRPRRASARAAGRVTSTVTAGPTW